MSLRIVPNLSALSLYRGLQRWYAACRIRGLSLLFPPSCVHCKAELPDWDDHRLWLCEGCREMFAPGQSVFCQRCGAVAAGGVQPPATCELCRRAGLHFDTVIALGAYQGPLREAILITKYAAGDSLCEALAELLFRQRQDKLEALAADLVVPVPAFWRRQVARGTNGPDILAARLGGRLRVPVEPAALFRRRNTVLQPTLTPKQRFLNVRGAFGLRRGYDLRGMRPLLVDDVLTTGATCSEAARVMKAAGASSVAVAVVAQGVGGS